MQSDLFVSLGWPQLGMAVLCGDDRHLRSLTWHSTILERLRGEPRGIQSAVRLKSLGLQTFTSPPSDRWRLCGGLWEYVVDPAAAVPTVKRLARSCDHVLVKLERGLLEADDLPRAALEHVAGAPLQVRRDAHGNDARASVQLPQVERPQCAAFRRPGVALPRARPVLLRMPTNMLR